MQHKNIILIGFMGTGKSAVGKRLASECGMVYTDIDHQITEYENKSIPDIFSLFGEDYFRKVETKVLTDALQNKNQVIATGGGAVLSPHNVQLMMRNGLVIHLKADETTIFERVKSDSARPLLQGDAKEMISKLLAKREGMYDFASQSIETDHRTVDEIVEYITTFISEKK
ncbi:shikimate kinase [Longirhabdus pacifica]|uniref:shikimate kinase n=1 Tax=Longirhabdus pacifica TaxID=2305227 RepID=UPI001008CCF3|nr:shikimate kinase [Longirhabdus pacifica]